VSDLKISNDILDELQSGLKSIVDQLNGSTNFSSEIEGLVGHSGLAGKVGDFANKWSVHRGKMINGTTAIHDSVALINSTFDKTEKELAKAVEPTSGGAGHGK